MEPEPAPVDVAPLQIETTASLHAVSPDMASWAPTRISAYRAEAGIGSPRGVLRIPSIGLEVPVYERVTESNLNRGAAWIDGTAPLDSIGNIGLAAHRDGYFRALRDIAIGDRIELQTLQGARAYEVEAISIVAPDEVQVLAPSSDDQLTLVTCYPFYMVGPAPKRFIVHARSSGTQAGSLAYRGADADSMITPHANRAPESPDG
jgi:sortase A